MTSERTLPPELSLLTHQPLKDQESLCNALKESGQVIRSMYICYLTMHWTPSGSRSQGTTVPARHCTRRFNSCQLIGKPSWFFPSHISLVTQQPQKQPKQACINVEESWQLFPSIYSPCRSMHWTPSCFRCCPDVARGFKPT